MIAEVAKKHGISDQTIYQWRKRFGKLEPADVKRLRHLEQENAKLKKLVAERDLEIAAQVVTTEPDGGHSQVGNGPIRRNFGMLDLRDAGPE